VTRVVFAWSESASVASEQFSEPAPQLLSSFLNTRTAPPGAEFESLRKLDIFRRIVQKAFGKLTIADGDVEFVVELWSIPVGVIAVRSGRHNPDWRHASLRLNTVVTGGAALRGSRSIA
jgi:hypothetical protein